jgi:hypothetical protein
METKTEVDIIPENASLLKAEQKKATSRSFLRWAILFFLGGIGSYGWWLYQDMRFMREGTNATGRITSSSTQTSSRKGKSYTTQIIHYSYEVEGGASQQGQDSVKTWRHKPSSASAFKPQSNDEIVVEYLKSSPEKSRIVIPNRYGDEYLFSILAMVAGGLFFLTRFINSQSTRLRLQCYGGLLMLIGSALIGWFVYVFYRSNSEVQRPGDFPLMVIVFFFLLAIASMPIWFGWTLIRSSRLAFRDPRELLDLEWMPRCPGRTSIMPRSWFGADAALILDHENRVIHFFNCHVLNGFIPRNQLIYSCKVNELERSEKTYSNKGRKITETLLKSPGGATRLNMHEAGVKEFLDLLDSMGSNRTRES